MSFENLVLAYQNARRGRRYCEAIMKIHGRNEGVIFKLIDELENKSWQSGLYHEFLCKTEVKRRIISAPVFRDRIIHHALINVVRPMIENKFIRDTYATIPGRGTHMAVLRVQKFLRKASHESGKVYVLQCDISKYYPHIVHSILLEEMSRTIRDKNVLWLWGQILKGFSHSGRGVPIGALTSQVAANMYLSILDHYIKDKLQVKFYVRYMDDFVLIMNSKKELQEMLVKIRKIVEGKLELQLNPKTRIYPAKSGVDFAGYRTWATHILPRKRNIKAAKLRFKALSFRFRHSKKMKVEDVQPFVASFLGYVKHCDAYATTESTLKWLKLKKGDSNC